MNRPQGKAQPASGSERKQSGSERRKIVLGIDPGLATMGYGVVERAGGRLRPISLGVIRTPATEDIGARLALLRRDLVEIVHAYQPDHVAIERIFFNANVRTAISVAQASGVALATMAELGLGASAYTPPEVKQAVAGTGSAPKRQVQLMVASLLGLTDVPRFPDAADACALAICHLNRAGLTSSIRRSSLQGGAA